MRKMGDILLDLEKVISEMIEKHELQRGDVLALVDVYVTVHHPEAVEKYMDGSPSPRFRYES